MPGESSTHDAEALLLEVREAVVEELLSSSIARTMRELETSAQKAIDRGGGGVAPTRVKIVTKEVVVRLEDEGHVRKNPGSSPSYELTPSGRAKLMF